ncbi:hypothetical protein ACFSHT_08690 [Paraburkholderia silviterrae]|uniref:Uncharacterized protein n=1 Tax=Paraburkholderia silviterrae TaxID=2528715 RepID=A0A4R5MDB6_9BURK|nr:hypothetical protein [Paraburkholderia silviterrae]TDG25076.1 hypothetical protein EYW47_04205 [Paraburkholderia silviterrae]
MGKFCVVTLPKKRNKGGYPVAPFIRLGIAEYSETEGVAPTISPDLATDAEIDAQIDRLKKDLDRVAREAKATLHREEARLFAAVTRSRSGE